MNAYDFGKIGRDCLMALDGEAPDGLRLQALAKDASTRTYYRIHLDDGTTLMLMRLAPDPLKSDEVVDGERPHQLPFSEIGRYLEQGNIAVPKIHFEDLLSGILILEDLGDTTLERALLEGQDKIELYRWAIDVLVDMQAYTAEHGDCIAFKREFGAGLLRWEFEHFHEWLLVEWANFKPTNGENEVLQAFYDSVVSRLVEMPQGFVHRDYQSRNLMISDSKLRVIDFQDALMGPWVYDLVALLRDSYVAFEPQEIDLLLKHFHEAREGARLYTPGVDVLRKAFHIQALQRKLKDAGRFVYIDRVRENPKFLPNIPRSLGYARSAFEFLGEFESANAILAKALPDFFA